MNFKDQVLAIIKPYQQKKFIGELEDGVLLTDAFGQHRWQALGPIEFSIVIQDIFAADIPEDDLCACKTIGDLLKVIIPAIKRAAIQKRWQFTQTQLSFC